MSHDASRASLAEALARFEQSKRQSALQAAGRQMTPSLLDTCPAIPKDLHGNEEQMSEWIAEHREELVANLMEGEIGAALAQSTPPKQSKTIDSKGRARNRLKMSDFMIEQEMQEQAMGRRKTKEELVDGLRISVYEKKLQTCAAKHFWSWHPDERLSLFWNGLSEQEMDEITSMSTEEEKAEMFRRIKAHKGKVCFSALDPLQTAKDKRFFDDKESLFIYMEMFRTAVSQNAPLAVTQQVVDIVHKVILSILVQMNVPCGANVQPGTYEYMAEHTTEHIRLLSMAEMLYLFEERLIERYHTDGPGKNARRQAEAAAEAAMMELLALEDAEAAAASSAPGKKGKVLQNLCTQLKERLTREISGSTKSGSGGVQPRVRSAQEAEEKAQASSDFERMLAEAKAEQEAGDQDLDDPEEEDEVMAELAALARQKKQAADARIQKGRRPAAAAPATQDEASSSGGGLNTDYLVPDD